jgi:beta-phosphoglucomutase
MTNHTQSFEQGFLFDLDGVIVDTAKFHFVAWRRMANEIGIDFNEEQNEQLKGVSRRESLLKIAEWGGKSLDENEIAKYMHLKNEWYLELIETLTPADILPGADLFIKEAKAAGIGIALGSASKNAVPILERIGMLSLFDAIVDGNHVSKSKPDPEVFLKGAEALGCSVQKSIVFEDSVAGIEAAKTASMKSIGIGTEDVLKNADIIVSDLSEITITKALSLL